MTEARQFLILATKVGMAHELPYGCFQPYAKWELVVRRSCVEPPRLALGNTNWWADIQQVLLDPVPAVWQREAVWRWIRDVVEGHLRFWVKDCLADYLVWQAIMARPRLLWRLPHHWSVPQEKYHPTIVAALMPEEMLGVERELRLHAPRLDRDGRQRS